MPGDFFELAHESHEFSRMEKHQSHPPPLPGRASGSRAGLMSRGTSAATDYDDDHDDEYDRGC